MGVERDHELPGRFVVDAPETGHYRRRPRIHERATQGDHIVSARSLSQLGSAAAKYDEAGLLQVQAEYFVYVEIAIQNDMR